MRILPTDYDTCTRFCWPFHNMYASNALTTRFNNVSIESYVALEKLNIGKCQTYGNSVLMKPFWFCYTLVVEITSRSSYTLGYCHEMRSFFAFENFTTCYNDYIIPLSLFKKKKTSRLNSLKIHTSTSAVFLLGSAFLPHFLR